MSPLRKAPAFLLALGWFSLNGTDAVGEARNRDTIVRIVEAVHMDEISRFAGIVIAMPRGEAGPARFFASYGDFEIAVEIESGDADGHFPRVALSQVLDWREAHKQELLANWRLAALGEPPGRIAPPP